MITSFVTFLFLLLLGFFAGSINERHHLSTLRDDEEALAHIKIVNIKTVPDDSYAGGILITGNTVITIDYFRQFISSLRLLFGGQMLSYEKLLHRSRREAIIRLKRAADGAGANAIYNVRLETSIIGANPSPTSGCELLAYGTAVKLH